MFTDQHAFDRTDPGPWTRHVNIRVGEGISDSTARKLLLLAYLISQSVSAYLSHDFGWTR